MIDPFSILIYSLMIVSFGNTLGILVESNPVYVLRTKTYKIKDLIGLKDYVNKIDNTKLHYHYERLLNCVPLYWSSYTFKYHGLIKAKPQFAPKGKFFPNLKQETLRKHSIKDDTFGSRASSVSPTTTDDTCILGSEDIILLNQIVAFIKITNHDLCVPYWVYHR